MKRYIRSAAESNHEFAKHSKDPKVLAQLANDKDKWVRWYVAKNPNTPADVLAQLANDEDAGVRWYVVQNPNTPADVLVQLTNDEDVGVRWYVAKNPNTPVDALAQLANDEDRDVREAAATNRNTLKEFTSNSSQSRESSSSTIIVAYMNFDSTPMLSVVSASELLDIRNQYDYVDTLKSKSGLVAVLHNDEDITIFKIAASESAWRNSLKRYYENTVLPELIDDGEAECYLFEDFWEFTIYDKEDCPNPDAYVTYCYNLIKDTYVDGDSYSNISIIDLATMNIVVSGSDYISICEYADEDF